MGEPASRVVRCEIPEGSLLQRCVSEGVFADCYCTALPVRVSHAEYVEAFYTTAVFKAERWLLKWAVSRPSSDRDAHQLAIGASHTFAAWRVEGRDANELLLADFTGRTKSWLMATAIDSGNDSAGTRLYFGSAVVPVRRADSRARELGFAFHSLLGFHKLYSRVLLSAVRARVARLNASA